MKQSDFSSALWAYSAWILGAALLTGCASEPTVIPTSYASYNSKAGTFACDAPQGWETTDGGERGPIEWAKFTSGPAWIKIQATDAGSLMSDAMGGRDADINAPTPQDAPVHHIHVSNMELAQDEFSGYTELPGSPAVFECSLGPARVSEFTASGFGGGLHGYRATIIGHKRGVRVNCVCAEADWKALKPVYDQVLASLTRGVQD